MVVGERWYVGGTAANSGSRSAAVVVRLPTEMSWRGSVTGWPGLEPRWAVAASGAEKVRVRGVKLKAEVGGGRAARRREPRLGGQGGGAGRVKVARKKK